jgi:peptidoglycan/xylan/chitin deacetylase (PgdA/CDA1 family)
MTNPSANQPIWRTLKRPISLVAGRLLGTVTHAETKEPVLALTFDDGPHPEYTLRLLEVLDKYQARATFFCVGKFAARHPEVIRQVAEAGHIVGNHTWDHPSFPLLTHRERCAQIRKCAEALKPYGSRLFRPPYGHQSIASRLDLLQLGYQVVGWTHGGTDWRLTDPEQIIEQVLPGIRPGSIVVFHDRIATTRSSVYFDRGPSVKAVKLLLERFSGEFRFVTVLELARHGHVKRGKWFRDADPSRLNVLIEEGSLPSRQYPLTGGDPANAPFYDKQVEPDHDPTKEGVS